MKIFPNTIEEMEEASIKQLLRAVICDRQSTCTNVYSPKYRTLKALYYWVNKNAPDKTLKEVTGKDWKDVTGAF